MALRATLLSSRLNLSRAPLLASALRSAPAQSARAFSASSGSNPNPIPPHLNTKRKDYLLNFKKASTMKEMLHYSSYFLAAGIPAALMFGSPVSTVVDYAACFVVPLHFHIGMRSVIVDYVHDLSNQQLALLGLASVTVATSLGLLLFNVTDVGITDGLKSLYIKQ